MDGIIIARAMRGVKARFPFSAQKEQNNVAECTQITAFFSILSMECYKIDKFSANLLYI
jgi:hypothetical protein